MLCLVAADRLTSDRIERNQAAAILQTIRAVMPAEFDNDIYHDSTTVHYVTERGERFSFIAYRARRANVPVGVVLMPVVVAGYNGEIVLAVGIFPDGSLSGVRIVSHRETKGLGSKAHQDQSDWLDVFAGRSLTVTPQVAWTTRDRAGDFDQLSGATITSQAIINAVRTCLQLYADKHDVLFAD